MPKGEDEFIAWIRSRDGVVGTAVGSDPAIVIGPGDDMALIRPGLGGLLVACDMLMDGVDFDSSVHSPRQMGRKALAVNLSDCAAMAVRPRWALVSVALPSSWSMSQAQELYTGAEAMAAEFECRIIGGDTNSWDRPLAVDVTILAEPWETVDDSEQPGRHGKKRLVDPVRRNGMRPGDAIFVTGRLGGSLAEHHLVFTPRVQEARALATALGADLHAMMDLSDGLSVDAARLATASGCGIEIDEYSIRALARSTAVSPPEEGGQLLTSRLLNDGEDFELLMAIPEYAIRKATALQIEALSCELSLIGRAVEEPGVWMTTMDGSRVAVEPRGWRHFQ